MRKRKSSSSVNKPYYFDHIKVYPEFVAGKFTITPGQKIKIKNQRGVFYFRQMVHNEELNVKWLDCMDVLTGEFRSFYVDLFKGPHVEKKPRKKKQVV